jgi:hypothetical protein
MAANLLAATALSNDGELPRYTCKNIGVRMPRVQEPGETKAGSDKR